MNNAFSSLGESRCAESVSLHRENFLAVRALDISLGSETFNPQNVSKINSVLEFTAWARAVYQELVFEDGRFSDRLGPIIDPWRSEKSQDDGVNSDNGLNKLKSKTQPKNSKESSSREVKQVRSELVFLKGDFANTSVNVALGFCLNSELGAGFLELHLKIIEFSIVHHWFTLQISLHSCQISGLVTVQNSDGRAIPL
jgi:hypothetical protein